jgi:diguanylate cyclase (GGDEF)-like protein
VAGEFSNAEAIKHAAAEGLGLACLSRLVVGDLLDMGKLVQVHTGFPSLYRNLYLVYNRNRVHSEMFLQFLQFCREWKFDLSQSSRLGEAQRELIRERDDFQYKSSIDGLTQLLNRHALTELLARELARAKRGSPMCVAMVDADFFKKINDTHGHQAGDAVLIEIATRIKKAIREVDSVGRYGGEEFLVILSNCELESALTICERICKSVSSESVLFLSKAINITVSVGLASFGAHFSDSESIVGAADAALYAAKSNGRNRVEVAN